MASKYSIQFKLGIGGIAASLIWIASKLGLFYLSSNLWLSICGLILSLVLFYHFIDAENKSISLVPVLLFFYSISTLVYFYQTENFTYRSNFDFNFLIYSTVFGFSIFFFTNSFYVETFNRFKFLLIAFVFFIASVSVILINSLIMKITFLNNLFSFCEKYLNILLSVLMLLILVYPVKDILNLLKKDQENKIDVPLS